MTQLLVSVRSAAEAEAALAGGAALIDVKEPAAGSLGRPPDGAVAAVVRAVAGRLAVSAAHGELRDDPPPFVGVGLTYAKWGLAGCGTGWRSELRRAARRQEQAMAGCRPVAVAYADWRQAGAPAPDDVAQFALGEGWSVLLLDTWAKEGKTLLDWLEPEEIERWCGRSRDAGVRLALAGSLGPGEIRRLRPVAPDWFAVRGAVCGGSRTAAVDARRVGQIAALLAEPAPAATCES